ncbi:MAG: hypothetical protein L6Q47_13110 [Ignavibacteriaceae bacterium]|nr:hypothetical protein [Ignavibacteriaceae bacterium]
MNKLVRIIIIFCISTCMYSCAHPEVTVENLSIDDAYYVVSLNGNRNTPAPQKLLTEYKTYYAKNGLNRKIYIGGKLTEKNWCWITDNIGEKVQQYIELKNRFVIDDQHYFGQNFEIMNLPYTASNFTDYSFTAHYGEQNTAGVLVDEPGYTPFGFTMRVIPANYKSLTYEIYQMEGYNGFDDPLANIIKTQFEQFDVFIDKNVNASNIPAVNWEYVDGIPIENDPIMQAVLKIMYPNDNLSEPAEFNAKLNEYNNLTPPRCILFFAKNYTVDNPNVDNNILGVTLGAPATPINNRGRLAVVFVENIRRLFPDPEKAKKVIYYTALHELGHNWGNKDKFTDNKTHLSWHNGNDVSSSEKTWKYCVMNTLTEPNLTDKRLENLAFCEGHIQRAGNICWEEKQYDPIGMHNTVTSETKQQSDDLKIEIFIDSTRYFRGKAINLFMKITNKTLQKLKYFGTGNFNLKSLETNMAIKDVNGNHKGTAIEIESGATHYYSYSLLPFYAHKGEDTIVYKPHYVGLGRYSFSVSINIAGGIKVNSNSINFEIIPLPEEYKMYYDLLDSSQFSRQKKINNYEKYNDSFFGYEFYTEGHL